MIVTINEIKKLFIRLNLTVRFGEHSRHFFYGTLFAYCRGIGNNTLHTVLLFQGRHNIRNVILICVIIKQNKRIGLGKNIGNRILFGQRVDGFCAGLQIASGDKQHNKQYRNNAAETVAETAKHRRNTVLTRFFRSLFLFGFFNRLMRQQYKCRQNGEHA